jgi:Na+-translocating ferredoxin:NAD+ oxidoreductase RnfG subunit
MFGMAYEHLAFVEFSSSYDIAKIVENVSLDTVGERLNLCVITQEITNELADRVIRYSELGSRIALIYVCKSKLEHEKAEWFDAINKSAVSLFLLDFESELRNALSSFIA